MSTPTGTRFPHRHNIDGSHDSICTACLATVAQRRDESELLEFESRHVCDPVRLFRRGNLSSWDQSKSHIAS
jgi:hypothetical protein